MPTVSIIICTYNPNPVIFAHCLSALEKAAALDRPEEILIIDNNSEKAVQSMEAVQRFATLFPFLKVIIEKEQGLTPARLRGIKEANSDLLIFVDDDNYIREDFIKNARSIGGNFPLIGSFSGQVVIQSDKTPPEWTRKYWGMLVHRVFTGNHWSNLYFNNETMPCGAGLCVRKEVASYYVNLHQQGKRRQQLDRSKGSLLSGGDNDLAMCAIDVNLGMGIFEDLYVDHFIPASRFTLDYLAKLAYGIYYSYVILKFMRTGQIEEQSSVRKFVNQVRKLSSNKYDKKIQSAVDRGIMDAARFLKSKTN